MALQRVHLMFRVHSFLSSDPVSSRVRFEPSSLLLSSYPPPFSLDQGPKTLSSRWLSRWQAKISGHKVAKITWSIWPGHYCALIINAIIQGVRKILPDPFISTGFYSFLFPIEKEPVCALLTYCTSADSNPAVVCYVMIIAITFRVHTIFGSGNISRTPCSLLILLSLISSQLSKWILLQKNE